MSKSLSLGIAAACAVALLAGGALVSRIVYVQGVRADRQRALDQQEAEAEAHLQRLLNDPLLPEEERLKGARELARLGDFENAARVTERAARASAQASQLWDLAARYWLRAKLPSAAVNALKRAEAAGGLSPDHHVLRARVLRLQKDPAAALATLEEAASRSGATVIRAALAHELADRKRFDDAAAVLGSEDRSPELEAERAYLLLQRGQLERALAVANPVAQAHPELARGQLYLGLIRAAQNSGLAVVPLRQAAALDPDDPTPLVALCRLSKDPAELDQLGYQLATSYVDGERLAESCNYRLEEDETGPRRVRRPR